MLLQQFGQSCFGYHKTEVLILLEFSLFSSQLFARMMVNPVRSLQNYILVIRHVLGK